MNVSPNHRIDPGRSGVKRVGGRTGFELNTRTLRATRRCRRRPPQGRDGLPHVGRAAAALGEWVAADRELRGRRLDR